MERNYDPQNVTIERVFPLEGQALADFARIYEGVLPRDEREPTDEVVAKINAKTAICIAAMDGAQLWGFAVLVPLHGDAEGMVYLAYLGVDPATQGRGLGGQLLARCRELCRDELWVGVVLEIETPCDPQAPNPGQRASRLKFYLTNGAVQVVGAPEFRAPDAVDADKTLPLWLLWLPGTLREPIGASLVICVRALLVQGYGLQPDSPLVIQNLEHLRTARL